MGWPAYALHRAYHLWAMPTAERKARIVLDWVASALLGRDPVATGAVVPAPRRGDAEPAVPEPASPVRKVPFQTLDVGRSAVTPAPVVRSDDYDQPTLREPHPSLPTPGGWTMAARPDHALTGEQSALTWVRPGRHDFLQR
jgi:NADH:quinone reductase (non-electrogenic)